MVKVMGKSSEELCDRAPSIHQFTTQNCWCRSSALQSFIVLRLLTVAMDKGGEIAYVAYWRHLRHVSGPNDELIDTACIATSCQLTSLAWLPVWRRCQEFLRKPMTEIAPYGRTMKGVSPGFMGNGHL